MKSATLEFPRSAQTVYTAVKHIVEICGMFSNIKCNDNTFVITDSHGMSLFPLGENIKIRIIASGPKSTLVKK